MSNKLTGQGMVDSAIVRIGTPYVYGAKIQDGPLTQAKVDFLHRNYPSVVNDAYVAKIKSKKLIGQICVDCSGLVSDYTKKILGSSQLYSTASRRMPFKEFENFAPGVVLWRSGHVGIYAGRNSKGQPYCIEAKGIDYGTISSLVTSKDKWKYGLCFSNIDYDYNTSVSNGAPKRSNPYQEPTSNVKKGTKGEGARWVQTELVEAGFGEEFMYKGIVYSGVKVDGEIGPISDTAIKAFQQSAKLTADGIVGAKTRAALHLDDAA